MQGIEVALVGLLAAPAAALLSWVLSRRKYAADTDSTVASAASTSVGTMLNIVVELRREVDLLRIENAELRGEIQALKALVSQLRGGAQ